MQTDGLDEIQRRLGYRFQRSSLLIEALTHKSYLNEAKDVGTVDNERLEFLGDAVLDLVVSEYLLSAFPDAAEGELYRNAIARAGRRRRLSVTGVRERELSATSAKALGASEAVVRQRVGELGRELGPPWTADQKNAALVAWLALLTRRG